MNEADHPGFPGSFVPLHGPGTEARDCINGVDDEKFKSQSREDCHQDDRKRQGGRRVALPGQQMGSFFDLSLFFVLSFPYFDSSI